MAFEPENKYRIILSEHVVGKWTVEQWYEYDYIYHHGHLWWKWEEVDHRAKWCILNSKGDMYDFYDCSDPIFFDSLDKARNWLISSIKKKEDFLGAIEKQRNIRESTAVEYP